ncbi:glycosyltransferase [Oceanobacillus kapialis]|uniref:Glycosyltransferase n=1 Tax=Oceanobacillus kapialis TaxID=481353 RepID=A0ABW5Q034_9BACI
MKQIKVVFFIYRMGSGGAARTFLNIINNLDRQKFSPLLVTLDYEADYESYLKEDIRFIKLDTKRLRSAIFPLAKLIRKEKADIVFSTIPNYNTIAILARLFSFTKAKNVVREAAYLGGDPKTDAKLKLYGMLYGFSSRVIALSEGVKANIVKRYNVKDRNINVIYNPIDIEGIEAAAERAEPIAEEAGLFTDDTKTIVTAGRLVDDKDHVTLLEAFAKVKENVASRLIIMGEGELEQTLKQKASSLGVADSVHFIGFQKNPYFFLKKSDVFVLSSKREGFGHVLGEALAVGTPIVSTDCKPGAQEVLDNGKYGSMCSVGDAKEMADKIVDILTIDQASREQIVQSGYERAQQFAAEKIVKQYEAVFENVLEPKN